MCTWSSFSGSEEVFSIESYPSPCRGTGFCLISLPLGRASLSHARFLSLFQLTLTGKQHRTLHSGQLCPWPHLTIFTMSPARPLHPRPTQGYHPGREVVSVQTALVSASSSLSLYSHAFGSCRAGMRGLVLKRLPGIHKTLSSHLQHHRIRRASRHLPASAYTHWDNSLTHVLSLLAD